MLKAQHVSVTLGGQPIVTDVSLSLGEGQWLMLCGPNGAGKSTLIGALSRAVPCTGEITLLGKPLRSYRPRIMARHLGVLSQAVQGMDAFTVEQIVAMGRYAYRQGMLGAAERDAPERVAAALDAVGLWERRRQPVTTLSGGERQRTLLAQVLCQDPDVLILDEPANHLDLKYQKQLFEIIDRWRCQAGKAVISVVHDLSLARRWGTHALLLAEGRAIAAGPVAQVLTSRALQSAWDMDVLAWLEELHGAWAGESIPGA